MECPFAPTKYRMDCFKAFCLQNLLAKLGPRSHLYTAARVLEEGPGKDSLRIVFCTDRVYDSSSPALTYDEDSQTTKVAFEKALTKGSKATLEMSFTGELNQKMAGFYRSTYKNADGSESIMATSQMEATDARRAFPCFDEPALKAEFTVTLIADKKFTCLSNMDVSSEKDVTSEFGGEVKKAVSFNKSPLMSTYLICFIIGELNYIESTKFRVPVRVYAPPTSDIEHGRFSLELAARTLEFYEKTFDSAFPLPKMVSPILNALPSIGTDRCRIWLPFLILLLGKFRTLTQ